jgi:threonyl-tRNA synthetase
MNYKLRDAELKLYNYVLVVGKKEIESNTATYRIINHKRNDQLLVPIETICEDIKVAHYNVTI